MHLDLENFLIVKLLDYKEFETQLFHIIKKLKLPNKRMGVNEIIQIEGYLKFYSLTIYDGELTNSITNLYTQARLTSISTICFTPKVIIMLFSK